MNVAPLLLLVTIAAAAVFYWDYSLSSKVAAMRTPLLSISVVGGVIVLISVYLLISRHFLMAQSNWRPWVAIVFLVISAIVGVMMAAKAKGDAMRS